MAYMSQEKKKQIAAKLKVALKGSGLKYSLGVHHHSTLVMKIKSGPVDFIQNYRETIQSKPQYARFMESQAPHYMRLNDFWYREQFTGKALALLSVIVPILNDGNHDRSDIQSDYFDVGWYLNVSIGEFQKPYTVTA